MKLPRIALWDWNGTVIDDRSLCLAAVNSQLVLLGHEPMAEEWFLEHFEFPLAEFYEKHGCQRESILSKAARDHFHEKFAQLSETAVLREGVLELVSHFTNRRVTNVVLTNYLKEPVQAQMRLLEIHEHFQAVSAKLNNHDIIVNACKLTRAATLIDQFNCDPRDAWLIGDTIEEIEAAREIGAISIAVAGGYVSAERLQAARPDYFFDDFSQLLELLTNGGNGNGQV